jgi:hypothetical protein
MLLSWQQLASNQTFTPAQPNPQPQGPCYNQTASNAGQHCTLSMNTTKPTLSTLLTQGTLS